MAYEDLLKDTSVADTSNNYFTLTITDLNPNTSYPIQLRWKYKDGTFSNWSAVKRLAAKALIPAPPSLPSVPTLKRVVGAIEISWDGKTSNGADQPPTSFVDAEIYISTVSDFTPIKGGATNNYIDILDFANGQNTLNIAVGTDVNPTFTIGYGIDYYVKIRSRNSENVYSSPVTANGSPIKVGQLSNDGLIEVKADKITTGTLQSNSTITVGATTGKHVVIRGTGNPLSIYGSGGSTTAPILDFDETGNLSIKGTITATGGVFEGSMSAGNMRIGTRVNYIDIANQKQVVINPAHWYGGEPLDGIYLGTNNYWYNDGTFEVGNGTSGITWDSTTLNVKGVINATGGYIGSEASGFTIYDFGIFSNGAGTQISLDNGGTLSVGTVAMTAGPGYFYMFDDDSNDIMSTEYSGRLIFGHHDPLYPTAGRQVEVARSAQVAGTANVNSRGLRNMYTITSTNFNSNPSVYLNDTAGSNGDLLLVYDPTS